MRVAILGAVAFVLMIGLAVAAVPMIEPPAIRDLDALEPAFRARVVAWLQACKVAGCELYPIETRRTLARQAWLYASGRDRSGPILTQTMKSNHLTGTAVDVWPKGLGFGSADAAKVRARLDQAAELAKGFGLRNLPSIGDYDHFEAV